MGLQSLIPLLERSYYMSVILGLKGMDVIKGISLSLLDIHIIPNGWVGKKIIIFEKLDTLIFNEFVLKNMLNTLSKMIGKRGDLFRGGFIPGGIWSYPAKTGGIYSGGDLFRGGFDPFPGLRAPGTVRASTVELLIEQRIVLVGVTMPCRSSGRSQTKPA